MNTYHEDLEQAVAFHGHLCSGQIIGVRMARLALRLLGIDDPAHYRDLIVYLECDRCLADAVGTVTHCTLGHRRLKWMDYGKTAATFLDLKDNRALRIRRIYSEFPAKGTDLNAFYADVTDEELFAVEEVVVDYQPTDLPGPPREIKVCAFCGEEILDGRQAEKDGKCCCRACLDGGYYKKKGSVQI